MPVSLLKNKMNVVLFVVVILEHKSFPGLSISRVVIEKNILVHLSQPLVSINFENILL